MVLISSFCFFFFNDPATTDIYTLSLHDALPISRSRGSSAHTAVVLRSPAGPTRSNGCLRAAWPRYCKSDRKSTRLNSSHSQISYAVFCLKKKKYHVTCIL